MTMLFLSRPTFPLRGIALLALAGFIVSAASAQSRIRLEQGGSGVRAHNELPVPIVVLAVGVDGSGQPVEYVSAHVGPQSTETLPLGRGLRYLIARAGVEAAHPRVPDTRTAWCGESSAGSTVARAGVERLLQAADAARITETPEALAALSAVMEVAHLEADQRHDEFYTALRVSELSSTAQYDYRASQREQGEAQRNYLLGTAATAAMEFGAGQSEQRRQLTMEADELEALASRGESLLDGMQRDVSATAEAASAYRAFAARVRDALGGDTPGEAVTVTLEPRRLCPGEAGLASVDYLEMRGAASSGSAVIHASMRFDRGGTTDVLFRRAGNTDRWVGAIYWPPDADSGRLEIAGNSRRERYEVEAGRPSMRRLAELAEREINDLRRRARATRDRSHGADHLRSIIVQ